MTRSDSSLASLIFFDFYKIQKHISNTAMHKHLQDNLVTFSACKLCSIYYGYLWAEEIWASLIWIRFLWECLRQLSVPIWTRPYLPQLCVCKHIATAMHAPPMYFNILITFIQKPQYWNFSYLYVKIYVCKWQCDYLTVLVTVGLVMFSCFSRQFACNLALFALLHDCGLFIHSNLLTWSFTSLWYSNNSYHL